MAGRLFGGKKLQQNPTELSVECFCQTAQDIDLAAALGVDQHLGGEQDTAWCVNSDIVECVLSLESPSQLVKTFSLKASEGRKQYQIHSALQGLFT